MKKVLSVFLTTMLLFAMAVTAFAAPEELEIEDGLVNETIVPGMLYKFEVFQSDNGSIVDKDFREDYRVSASVKSGDSYIDTFSLRDDGSGDYYLNVRARNGSYTQDKEIVFKLSCVNKKDTSISWEDEFSFHVGYETGATEVDDDVYDVYYDDSRVTFAKGIGELTLRFGPNKVETKLATKRTFNLAYDSPEVSKSILTANDTVDVRAFEFVGKPEFDLSTKVFLDVAEKSYVYERTGPGVYTPVDASYEGGYMTFKTYKLGYYLISTEPLKGINLSSSDNVSSGTASSAASSAPASSKPASSNTAVDSGKPNPGMGMGNNMTGAAVMLTVVTAMAVVAVKKSK